jgi:hypothetical protein
MHIAFGFAHLWQQQEFADVDLLLTAAGVDTTDTQQHTLLTVPGHRSILSNSDFIRAQVRAWMAACKFFLPGCQALGTAHQHCNLQAFHAAQL